MMYAAVKGQEPRMEGEALALKDDQCLAQGRRRELMNRWLSLVLGDLTRSSRPGIIG